MTSRDPLDELGATVVDHRTKGIPLGERLLLREVGKQGWNVARGDLALPVTTLSQSALGNNLDTMRQYCERHGVLLAPHGKTTMSPQLFQRQLAAGAWGMTAATPTQAAVMRHFGVSRVIVANEVVEPTALRWIAREMDADPLFEVLTLVDDPSSVAAADQTLAGSAPTRPLPVLLEVGIPGGRAGVRTLDQAMAVARAVASARHLALAGVEIYEGLITNGTAAEDLAKIDRVLDDVRIMVDRVAAEGLFADGQIIVTAGGSAYFDRVIAVLNGSYGLGVPVRLVLRSGCYLTHDLGKYNRVSPLDGRRSEDESLQLVNALQGWARVLSRPDPELAILGTGKRDLPYDLELPSPLTAYDVTTQAATDLREVASIHKMMDQHAFMTISQHVPLHPGDIIALGMSHPCTAFDKARLIPIIDDDNTVIDAVLTFF
jgi:D-serine dehydratase